MNFRLVKIFLVVICFVFLRFDYLYAQQGSGIGIRPATIEENITPATAKTFSMTVSNLSGNDQVYYLFARDISSATEEGTPIFSNSVSERTGYELADWVTFETKSIAVPAGSEVAFNFTIAAPADASPGSHFAGVFVSNDPPTLERTGAAVGYQVVGIVSIRIPGEVVEKASIRQFSTDNYIYSNPTVNFRLAVENSGNTLVRPSGPLIIKNMFGRDVSKVTFNESRGGVFPKGTRNFTFKWEGEPPGFGRYEAMVSLVYGESGARQTISSTVVFWILPMNIILPALGILLFILLVTYLLARMYVRRKLSRYAALGTGRRLVRRQTSNSSAFVFITITILIVTALFLLVLLVLFA